MTKINKFEILTDHAKPHSRKPAGVHDRKFRGISERRSGMARLRLAAFRWTQRVKSGRALRAV